MVKKQRLICLSILGTMIALVLLLFFALQNGNAHWFSTLLQKSDVKWGTPPAFGSFHLVWLSVCLVFTVLLGIFGWRIAFFHSGKEKTDLTVFCAGCVLFVLEGYKQFYSYFVLNDRNYDFSVFPFQFCSLPLYLFLIVPLLKEGRIKDLLYRFLSLFGTMGGCLVMAYPAFFESLSLCCHTMIWHTAMISVGTFLLFSRGYGKNWTREVLPASVVFLLSVAFATFLNIVLTPLAKSSPNPLNLFYMSPYEQTYFWVIGDIQQSFGWLWALLAYACLFIFVGATAVFFVAWGIRKLDRIFFLTKTKEKDENI